MAMHVFERKHKRQEPDSVTHGSLSKSERKALRKKYRQQLGAEVIAECHRQRKGLQGIAENLGIELSVPETPPATLREVVREMRKDLEKIVFALEMKELDTPGKYDKELNEFKRYLEIARKLEELDPPAHLLVDELLES